MFRPIPTPFSFFILASFALHGAALLFTAPASIDWSRQDTRQIPLVLTVSIPTGPGRQPSTAKPNRPFRQKRVSVEPSPASQVLGSKIPRPTAETLSSAELRYLADLRRLVERELRARSKILAERGLWSDWALELELSPSGSVRIVNSDEVPRFAQEALRKMSLAFLPRPPEGSGLTLQTTRIRVPLRWTKPSS